MKKIILSGLLALAMSIIMAGCSSGGASEKTEKTKVEGYIIEVEKNRLLLVENVTLDEYNEIKDLSLKELSNLEDIPNLMYVTYEKTGTFKKGDKVNATISDGIAESFPAQAKAEKIGKID